MKKALLALGLLAVCVAVGAARGDHIQELGKQAAGLRGLSYRPIPSQVVSQKDCATYLMHLLDKEMEPTRTRKREAFLRHLGLLTGPRSMKQIYAEILSEQVRGLYDPAKKRYLVVTAGGKEAGGMGAMAAAIGLNIEDIYTVHELGHAIQDQHFNLSRLSQKVADDFDEELAAQSLIEGDASVLMMDYALKSIGMDPAQVGMAGGMPTGMGSDEMMMMSSPSLAKAPRFFREILSFPYAQGLTFVNALKAKGGWKSVDRAFSNLPESSEQIFHPEKYGRDHPQRVKGARLPLDASWKPLGHDTAGEFTIHVWAEENGATVTGWGGDSYEVYASGEGTTAVWDTVWDSDRDAAEFERLAVKALSRTRGKPSQDGHTKTWTHGRLHSQCDRKGRRVQVVFDYPKKR